MIVCAGTATVAHAETTPTAAPEQRVINMAGPGQAPMRFEAITIVILLICLALAAVIVPVVIIKILQ